MSIEKSIAQIVKNIFHKKIRNPRNIREIDYSTLMKIIKQDKNSILVDVRSVQEHNESKITPSINIPLYELELKAENILQDKEATIILYCQSGVRSTKAYKILEKKGYKNLYTLSGGIDNI